MTEQQYTCPSCHKDYTRFTISEHYCCGVEPLEAVQKPAILENIHPVDSEHPAALVVKEISQEDAKELYPAQNEQPEAQKPAPKKRGPKPKLKAK